MRIFGNPANHYGKTREENASQWDQKARNEMLEHGRVLLRMAEEAEAEGDTEKAQLYRRTLGD